MKFKFLVVFLFFTNICPNSEGTPYRDSAKGKEIVEAEDKYSNYEKEEEKIEEQKEEEDETGEEEEEEEGEEEEEEGEEEEEEESQVSNVENNTSDEEEYSGTQSSLKEYPKLISKRKDDDELFNHEGVQIIGKIKVVNMISDSENSNEKEEDLSSKLRTRKSFKKYLKSISKGIKKKKKVNYKGVQIFFEPTIVNLITLPGSSKTVQQDTGFCSPEIASSSNTKSNNKKREKHSSRDLKYQKGHVNTMGIQITTKVNVSNRVTHRKSSKKQDTNLNAPKENLLKLKPVASAAGKNAVKELADIDDEEETKFTPKSKIIKNTGNNYNNEGIQISGKVKSINQIISPCPDEQPTDESDEEKMQLPPDSKIFVNSGYNYNRKGTQVNGDAEITLKNLVQDVDSDTVEEELTIELISADFCISEADTNSITDTEIKIEIFPFDNATDEDTYSEGEIIIEIIPCRCVTTDRIVEIIES